MVLLRQLLLCRRTLQDLYMVVRIALLAITGSMIINELSRVNCDRLFAARLLIAINIQAALLLLLLRWCLLGLLRWLLGVVAGSGACGYAVAGLRFFHHAKSMHSGSVIR